MQAGEQTGGSVGVVETRVAGLDLPPGGLVLDGGGVLSEINVAYEAYGARNAADDNTVFICHALSGNAHAAGRHDPPEPDESAAWWDEMIGPGKGIDTNHYHVICANILGGCKGTTGPASLDPATGKPYGAQFPDITVGDTVTVHRLLLHHLGVRRLAAVIGGSYGGMQVIEWLVRFPDMIERGVVVASCASLSAQALAFDVVGRKAIMNDPDWQGGDYYDSGRGPDKGLSLARKVGHITYLSREIMAEKFGREKWTADDLDAYSETTGESRLNKFQVQTYLEYQGEKFVRRFDANSYLHITRAMDEYDVAAQYGSLEAAFARIRAKVLVVAVSSDWLFPPEQSTIVANAMLRAGKDVSYCLLSDPHGHDAFLVDVEHLAELLRAFLPWVGDGPARARALPDPAVATPRVHTAVMHMVREGTRVLDLGCGNGELLSLLARARGVHGMGMDIDVANVIAVVERGHDILQADLDEGLASIPDLAYDYAIVGETLQVVRKPRFVLREILRVAREGIVSFPNFGNWRHRLSLMLSGRMPKSRTLPFEWYDTPNIHLFTVRDFLALCREDGIRVLEMKAFADNGVGRGLVALGGANVGADSVVIRIARR